MQLTEMIKEKRVPLKLKLAAARLMTNLVTYENLDDTTKKVFVSAAIEVNLLQAVNDGGMLSLD
jgi:hypothetical protein